MKMENLKRISIVLPVLNGARFIREQMDSLVNQTYPIYELIVQDNCSTDNTVDILNEYAAEYQFVRIINNKERKSLNENFYSAMEVATGEYIALSDCDDVWELDKIESQIKSIGDKWLCGGLSRPFNEHGYLPFDNRMPNIQIERLIHIASALPGNTMLIKRDILSLILQYRHVWYVYDHTISLIAGSYNQIAYINKILVNHREHASSATFTVPVMDRSGKKNKSIANILKSIARTFRLYFEIKLKKREWFSEAYNLLNSLPEKNSMKSDAQKIAYYQSQSGIINYVKLTCMYVKVRTKLFHVVEKDNLFTLLRALYYPISCSDYFRYMSKRYAKK
jgi:glycosyltransferase involved in cell wall biosynthesis